MILTVRDDGVGIAPGFDWEASDSIGLQLVSALTEQLEGSARVENDGGTIWTIRFCSE